MKSLKIFGLALVFSTVNATAAQTVGICNVSSPVVLRAENAIRIEPIAISDNSPETGSFETVIPVRAKENIRISWTSGRLKISVGTLNGEYRVTSSSVLPVAKLKDSQWRGQSYELLKSYRTEFRYVSEDGLTFDVECNVSPMTKAVPCTEGTLCLNI